MVRPARRGRLSSETGPTPHIPVDPEWVSWFSLRYRDAELPFQLDLPQEYLPGLATGRYDPATSGRNLIFTFI